MIVIDQFFCLTGVNKTPAAIVTDVGSLLPPQEFAELVEDLLILMNITVRVLFTLVHHKLVTLRAVTQHFLDGT